MKMKNASLASSQIKNTVSLVKATANAVNLLTSLLIANLTAPISCKYFKVIRYYEAYRIQYSVSIACVLKERKPVERET